MFVKRVLGWISPLEKSKEIGEETSYECTVQQGITKNTEERQLERTQKIYPSTRPDRNTIDNIEKELLRLHEEKFQVVTFLEGGDFCVEKQQHSDKKADIMKKDHVGVGGDVIEQPRTPRLSPLCKRIFQKPSRRNIFTQTDSKVRYRMSRQNTLTNSSHEKDLTISKSNQIMVKDPANSSEGIAKPEIVSPKNAKEIIASHSSVNPNKPLGNGILLRSPKKTKENIDVYKSVSSTKPEVMSSNITKEEISIHSPESPKEPLRSAIHSPKKTNEKLIICNSDEVPKPDLISPNKPNTTISTQNSECLEEPFSSTSCSPKRTKGVTFIQGLESPKEQLKNSINSPKRVKGSIDIHSPIPHSPKKQPSIAIQSPNKSKEMIDNYCSQKQLNLIGTVDSPKETKENLFNYNTSSSMETLGYGIYSSPETEEVDLLSGRTPVSPKTEESAIPSRALTLLREVASQYPKEMLLDSGVYGELLVLGTSSRFVLRRRAKANGVKEATSIISPTAKTRKRTVSFQVSSASRSMVVQYIRDPTSDMFQVGRHERTPVDISVTNSNGRKGVSRFACRLLIQRQDRRDARLYAAAFDASGNVFLGESGVCETDGDGMDGFTTNGVLLRQPGGEWREVSVRGRIYSLRSDHGINKRRRMISETNVLLDGSLIDLCGVTLLWRTREGIEDTPGEDCLVRMQGLLRELAPVCHHDKTRSLTGKVHDACVKEVFVFLSCGHVVSMETSIEEGMVCPECGRVGSVKSLLVGKERGFYADREMPPSHAFRPCGHVSTLGTVRFWSVVGLPHGGREKGICPFCATRLHPVHKFVGLVYPRQCSDGTDERFLIKGV